MREAIYKEVLRLKIQARLKRECLDRPTRRFAAIPVKVERVEPDGDGPNWRLSLSPNEVELPYRMAWSRVRAEFEDSFNISDS